MKRILQLSLLVIAMFINAQYYRFEYELSIKEDTLDSKPEKFNTALEILPDLKKYYDMDIFQADSINKKKGSSGYMDTGFKQNLLKLKSDQINQTFQSVSSSDWYRLKSKDLFDWKITHENKTEKGYKLQKATTVFGGRIWTAWFTQDIPIPEGPYKFSGLPGLIVELYDSRNHYHYILTKVNKLETPTDTYNIIEKWKGKKAIDITLETYQKLLLEHYNEPFKNELSSSSFIYIDAIAGKRYTKVEELREARIDERSRIKRNYNPIELDKAVKYPD